MRKEATSQPPEILKRSSNRKTVDILSLCTLPQLKISIWNLQFWDKIQPCVLQEVILFFQNPADPKVQFDANTSYWW